MLTNHNKMYRSDKPCKQGHLIRYKKSNACVECSRNNCARCQAAVRDAAPPEVKHKRALKAARRELKALRLDALHTQYYNNGMRRYLRLHESPCAALEVKEPMGDDLSIIHLEIVWLKEYIWTLNQTTRELNVKVDQEKGIVSPPD